jgi:DNA-binding GntR family transcriptional regulator
MLRSDSEDQPASLAGLEDVPRPAARMSTEWVHDRVREAIIRGDIPAGAPISQVELADALGVSRTPLREALRLLQREGLIEGRVNQRPRVAPVSWSDLEQLYAMRVTLEATAAILTVPRLTPERLDAMRDSLAQFERAGSAGDHEAAGEHHRAFHMDLISGAGDRIGQVIGDLWDHSERYRRLFFITDSAPVSRLESAQREHDEIIRAAAAGDAWLTAELLARHLARTALAIIADRAPEHDPAVIRAALRLILRSEVTRP